MTPKEAIEFSEIMKAFSEGKSIEYSEDGVTWKDVVVENREAEFDFDLNFHYRIKNLRNYRPFANMEECFKEMSTHFPFGWITKKPIYHELEVYQDIDEVSNDGIVLIGERIDFEEAFEGIKFIDGTPFGIKLNNNE